jgi:hypothetical protein
VASTSCINSFRLEKYVELVFLIILERSNLATSLYCFLILFWPLWSHQSAWWLYLFCSNSWKISSFSSFYSEELFLTLLQLVCCQQKASDNPLRKKMLRPQQTSYNEQQEERESEKGIEREEWIEIEWERKCVWDREG